MVEFKVEAVSQTKKGIKVNGGWINADRTVGTFKDLAAGDTITDVAMSDDGKWVKSYKLKSGGSSVAPQHDSQDRDSRITRGNAVNATLATSYAHFLSKGMGENEALTRSLEDCDTVAEYIQGGMA